MGVVGMIGVSASSYNALFSADWRRVAALRPRLRASVRVQRQPHRDQIWHQLIDAGTGRRHRLNDAAYRFAGLLNGNRTTHEAWDAVIAQVGDAALTQNDALRVLGQLNNAGVLQCELTPDVERLFRQMRRDVKRKRFGDMNPLAVKVRLFNPTRLLDAIAPWFKVVLHPAMLLLWLAVLIPALLLTAQHWSELTAFAATHADSTRYLLIAWGVYPVMKALHELGHALMVRRFGGAVTEAGFTLLVLVPAPYVDASAASSFTRPAQRALVSAAGIAVELFIAALALIVWLNVQPGWVSDIAFVTMLVGGISTLFINGNPLLRFDGYYVLCDALDLPNLDQRSRAWWTSVLQRRVLSMPVPGQPVAAGELKWLVAYAPLALVFRLYVGLMIALWMSLQSLIAGALAFTVAVIALLLMPLFRFINALRDMPEGRERRRGLGVLWAGAAILLALFVFLPLPYGAVAQGVVWLPERAELRAGTDGVVRELKVRDGDAVKAGDVLALLDDPELIAKQTEARERLSGLRVQYFNVLHSDRAQAQNFAKALEFAETEAAHYDTRVEKLEIRAQATGRVALVRQDDIPGSYLKKGQMLGHVFTPGEVIVRAAVADEDGALVRERARAASVWLTEQPGKTLQASVRRDVPASSFKLPNAALSDRNGGDILTDPADTDNLRTLQPVFAVDVALGTQGTQGTQSPERIGGRAWVRFDLGSAPLAVQWAHAASRLFLKHMEKAV